MTFTTKISEDDIYWAFTMWNTMYKYIMHIILFNPSNKNGLQEIKT